MQVQFTNTDKTAGTVDGRAFTISATGNIWVNRSKASKAVAEAINAAKAAKPEAKKSAPKLTMNFVTGKITVKNPAKAVTKPVTVKKAEAGKEHKLPAKPAAATFGSFMTNQLAAVKPAAKKAAPDGGRAPTLADDSKITLLVKENPKREGCAAYERFNAYFTVKTVAQALAAGLTRKDLAWDIAHGHISVK